MSGMKCPCGTGRLYNDCCGPFHQGRAAATPVLLMRSRYSAFALGSVAYLRDTWHVSTRPDLDLADNPKWIKLEILAHSSHVESSQPKPGETGFVHFKAHYQRPDAVFAMDSDCLEEYSRFVFEASRWWYVDGKIF